MNGFLIIDKPKGFTSHDVVAKCRGLLKTRRIGHGGTLDPMATGVLPLFIGRATKAVDLIPRDEKRYTALVLTGLSTDSGDITGQVTGRAAPPCRAAVERAVVQLTGEIGQIPPMVSAVRVGGRHLYELARRGQEVERPARRVTIYSSVLAEWREDGFVLDVRCSKGTYIRTLAEDICRAAGTLGTLGALRRTESAGFTEADAVTLEAVQAAADAGRAEELLRPVEQLFCSLPRLTLTAREQRLFLNGVNIGCPLPEGRCAVYGPAGFLAVAEAAGGLLYKKAAFAEDIQ